MTVQQYSKLLKQVKTNWNSYPQWMKEWTRARLQELSEELEE